MLSLMDEERCETTGRGGEEEVRRRMKEEEILESLGRTVRALMSDVRAASGSSSRFDIIIGQKI